MALVLMAIAACGEPTAATSTTSTTPVTTSSTTSAPASTTTTSAPSTDVQAEIDWFVSILNGGELSEAEYVARFDEAFRAQVPFDTGMQAVLQELQGSAPFTVTERGGEGAQGFAVVEGAGGTSYRIDAQLDDQGRFSGLTVQPAEAPSLEDPPQSVAEAFERLGEIGTTRAVAAEIVDGRCETVEAVSAGEPAPLGSAFKLYVLAALGEAVSSGDVSWQDEIVIRDELKSIPSGVLQDRPDGDTVSVLEAAELMISISDNTATDHLIDLLGRETVEGVQAGYGNTTPQLNIPMMNTRELTALKIGPASGLHTQWLDGDESDRRAILTQISDITPADLPIQEWTEPILPDQLEWFASPNDLCSLGMRLGELAGAVPEIDEILSMNPGIPAPSGTWDSIWFKGGSEPGLVATWFVTRSGDRAFVTAGSVVDPSANIDTEQAILLFAAARDLLSP
jgi:Beta-lactamase enzyme family/ORF 12 gene product N-terminal